MKSVLALLTLLVAAAACGSGGDGMVVGRVAEGVVVISLGSAEWGPVPRSEVDEHLAVDQQRGVSVGGEPCTGPPPR